MKRYEQTCAIARALDIRGERWSLLLVRELTLGPRALPVPRARPREGGGVAALPADPLYSPLPGGGTVTGAVRHGTMAAATGTARRALEPLAAVLAKPAPSPASQPAGI